MQIAACFDPDPLGQSEETGLCAAWVRPHRQSLSSATTFFQQRSVALYIYSVYHQQTGDHWPSGHVGLRSNALAVGADRSESALLGVRISRRIHSVTLAILATARQLAYPRAKADRASGCLLYTSTSQRDRG